LTYLNNRYYDPSIGEFISVDPLVAKTGDPYLYANGNPTTLSDPNGLEAFPGGEWCKCSNPLVSSGGGIAISGNGTGKEMDLQLSTWALQAPRSRPIGGKRGDDMYAAGCVGFNGHFSIGRCSDAALAGNLNAEWMLHFLANQLLNGVVSFYEGRLTWMLDEAETVAMTSFSSGEYRLTLGETAGIADVLPVIETTLEVTAVVLYALCPLSEGATCVAAAGVTGLSSAIDVGRVVASCGFGPGRDCAGSVVAGAVGFIPGPMRNSESLVARGFAGAVWTAVTNEGGDYLGTIVSGATVDPAWGTTVIRYLP
jgi:hypothetical protein